MRFLYYIVTETTMAASIENILVHLRALLFEIQRLASAALDAGFEILALVLAT
jgi:hypothetical protein